MATAAQTPARKGVRWAFDVANSPFGGAAEPSTPETSTSSLAYVNSQIIAHGFARTALDLSELGREEQNRVVKCILGMLSQRVDDMTRAEDLSSRLRTLSYEHERLSNMLRTAKNEVLQAEREAEAARTKTNLLTKDLSAANSSHNRTTAQLAQTTSAVAALRAASTADMRKREQDVARLKERWQRLAGEQAKLGSVGSGLVCANWAVAVNEQYVGLRGEGEEAAEGAMRDAIEARERLAAENDEFREVLVKLVGVVGEGLKAKEVEKVKLPTPSALFTPPAIEDDAGPPLNAYRALRDLIQELASTSATTSPDQEAAAREAERAKAEAHRTEIRAWEEKTEKLEREIARLTGELAASNDFAEKSRILIEQMANDKKVLERSAEEHVAGEAASLAAQRTELEEERAKFTDAAIRLARERSEFEVERLQLAEDKRQWALRQLEEPELLSVPVIVQSNGLRSPSPPLELPAEPVTAPSEAGPAPEEARAGPAPKEARAGPAPKETRAGPAPKETRAGPAPKETRAGPAPKEGVAGPAPKGDADEMAPEAGPAPKETGDEDTGLAGRLRSALKAAAAAESGDGREKRKATSSRDKARERGKEKEKKKDVVSPGRKRKRGEGSGSGSGRSKAVEPAQTTTSTATATTSTAPIPPSTPRSLHPAAQRARARNYAPAVPSPLSRILSMAVSPEARVDKMDVVEEEEVVRLPRKSPLKASGGKSPLRSGKSPQRGSKTKTSVGGGSLAEKFAAAAAKSKTDKGKGRDERDREQEEKDKEQGKDLDIILAPAKASGAGPSRLPTAKPTRVPVMAKRALTPRKAAVGGTRAKRAWKG